MFTFDNMIVQDSLGVMEVDGLDIDVSVEGVLVEENRTTCEVSHKKAFMSDCVVDVVRSFLQSDEVPLSCNLFFDSISCASSKSRIPVVNTKPHLQRRLRSEEKLWRIVTTSLGAVGMLGTLTVVWTIDAFGPVSDN